MRLLRFIPAVLALAVGLTVVYVTPGLASPNAWYQYCDRYGDIRGLVDRTQNDLRVAASLGHNKGESRRRYEHTQKHLSTFDRHLTKGNFAKGELNDAISDLHHILDKNTLDPRSRDALSRDIEDLRAMREHR